MNDLSQFKELAATNNEAERRKWVKGYLDPHKIYKDKIGNIYAIKNPIEFTPTLNAHLDTVHDGYKQEGKKVFHDSNNGVMWSPEGIGGDDICGIFVASYIFKHSLTPIQVVFTVEEESGGQGSQLFNFTHTPAYIATIDRRGVNDLVTSISGQELMNTKLKKLVKGIAKKHGRQSVEGLFADAYTFACRGYATMNMSCGYYNPHQKSEYISIPDMMTTIQFVTDLLANIPMIKHDAGTYLVPKKLSKNKYNTLFSFSEDVFGGQCEICSDDGVYKEQYEMVICNSCIGIYY